MKRWVWRGFRAYASAQLALRDAETEKPSEMHNPKEGTVLIEEFPSKESIELMREDGRHGDAETEHELEEITHDMREYAEDLLDRIGEGR